MLALLIGFRRARSTSRAIVLKDNFNRRYDDAAMTELTLTTVFEEAEEGGYIGYVAELPGANTQGETLEETRENLTDAIQLILSEIKERLAKKIGRDLAIRRP
jgi:predicted RNase H-like HicB family nuclease